MTLLLAPNSCCRLRGASWRLIALSACGGAYGSAYPGFTCDDRGLRLMRRQP